MNKKIILFDIDGTLIDCQKGHTHLTKETKKALKLLKEAGHYIFIASGRPYCYLLEELTHFEFDGYILDDGSYVLFNNEELLYYPLEANKLDPLLEQVKDMNMTCVLYTKKNAYFYNDDGTLKNYAQSFMINDKYVKVIDNVEDKKDNVLKMHIQAQNLDDYKNFMINKNDFFVVSDTSHYLYEIINKKHNKATALAEVLKVLKIKKENSYFFGDGYNDIEMMDYVGCAIAMANAPKDVQSHADYVCKSVDQNGVADFIINSGLFK